MREILFIAGAVLSIALPSYSDDKKAFDDQDFTNKAASGGMHEVKLGKIATMQGKSSEVKELGKRLAEDHSKANAALKKAATESGLTVPEKISDQDQKHVDFFANYKGDNFDRDFIKHIIKDHEADVKAFTRATQEASHPAIKDFASKTLPVIKEHLKLAQHIQDGQK